MMNYDEQELEQFCKSIMYYMVYSKGMIKSNRLLIRTIQYLPMISYYHDVTIPSIL